MRLVDLDQLQHLGAAVLGELNSLHRRSPRLDIVSPLALNPRDIMARRATDGTRRRR